MSTLAKGTLTMTHILMFMTDDHAQWALPAYGNREIIAPTLTYLADTGVRMAKAFTPTPVCSPARASFWTGLFPSQHGIHDYINEDDKEREKLDWLGDEVTLATRLQESGYTTALCGKWHCGNGRKKQPGFDVWQSTGSVTARYNNLDNEYSDEGDVYRKDGYETQIITDNAVRFLRERDTEKPFFLFVGYTTTHSPWVNHPERLVSHYRNCRFDDIPDDTVYPFGRLAGESTLPSRFDEREAQAQYYACVTQIDEQVGRLLDELDALKLRDDTLVIYTADHGLNCGHHGVWGKGNGTRPLNMLEESIRVPLIFNHPGTLFAGQVRSEFTDHTDLFKTVLDYAEINVTDERYPGKSFKTMLTEARADPDWKDVYIGEYGNLRAIRTDRYKLVRRYPSGPNQLFDLVDDPRETRNLFNDPAYGSLIEDLTARMDSFFRTYQDEHKSGLNVHNLPVHNPVEAWRGEMD